jgi:hypothetical protein
VQGPIVQGRIVWGRIVQGHIVPVPNTHPNRQVPSRISDLFTHTKLANLFIKFHLFFGFRHCYANCGWAAFFKTYKQYICKIFVQNWPEYFAGTWQH